MPEQAPALRIRGVVSRPGNGCERGGSIFAKVIEGVGISVVPICKDLLFFARRRPEEKLRGCLCIRN